MGLERGPFRRCRPQAHSARHGLWIPPQGRARGEGGGQGDLSSRKVHRETEREARAALPRHRPVSLERRDVRLARGDAPQEPRTLPAAHGERARRHRAGGRRARGPNVSAPVPAPGKGLHRLRANGEDFRRLCRSRRPRVERRGKLGGRVRASEKGRARERPAAGEPPVRRAREHGVFAGQVRFGAGGRKPGGD